MTTYAFCIDLHYKLYPEYDLMERSVVLKNEMEEPIQIEKLHSAQFHIPYENLNFTNVHGHWGAEQQRFTQRVSYGKILIENRRGISSHNHNPYFILDRDATETTGEVFFGALRADRQFQRRGGADPLRRDAGADGHQSPRLPAAAEPGREPDRAGHPVRVFGQRL